VSQEAPIAPLPRSLDERWVTGDIRESNDLAQRWCKHCNREGDARLIESYDAWLCCRCTKITNGLEAHQQCCPACGRKRKEEGRDTCFRCRIATVGINWHGGGRMFGRQNFSERTNAEFVAEHVGDVSNASHIGSLDWKDV
jgi:hypothetical protein